MDALTALPSSRTPWSLPWLTPLRCRAILAVLLIYGFWSHLHYLRHDCPIDLSGDEAQYWDWSRALDWSYYSKGPAIAYIIRASTSIFGNEMWAVRLPALVFAVATTLLTYYLTWKLFKSDRLALGVILLNHLVPMFVAGSLLMTIDPPYFFCWGLATTFLAIAVFDDKRWPWIGVGIALGLGTLAKYGTLLWPIGMVIFLWLDRRRKNWLRTPWPWVAIAIALLFLTPVVIWNAQHDWVTFKHVAKQTGAAQQKQFFNGNFWEFVGSQIGVLLPPIAVILAGAILYGLGSARRRSVTPGPELKATARMPSDRVLDYHTPIRRRIPVPKFIKLLVELLHSGGLDPNQREVRLLLWTGLPLFGLCLIMSIRSKMQINWPAAAYFSWMILAAYFISTRLKNLEAWKRWRGWVWGAIVVGIIMMPVAHNFEIAYPILKRFNLDPRKNDPTAKLKGWKELGQRIAVELPKLNNAFILCEDYMQTAETAFYTPGQPKTFCAGAYLSDPKRHTQYDIWPDRSLSNPAMKGRDAIYIGYMDDNVRKAFASVEELAEEPIFRRGQKVRRFKLYACRDFKGMTLTAGSY